MTDEALTLATNNKRSRSDDEEETTKINDNNNDAVAVAPPAKIQKSEEEVKQDNQQEDDGQQQKENEKVEDSNGNNNGSEDVDNKDTDDAVNDNSKDVVEGGNQEEKQEEPAVELIEERDEVSAQYVGRVIGKGGEMIRDLQARSGCRIDVDQNVPEGAPRSILYRGTRKTIDFAQQLVSMLCAENGQDAELPLGEAKRKILNVPANVIGKIIGRGGEMIRELQNKSQAKIQVDHTGAGTPGVATRQVTLTGTEVSVVKAEEMINFLTANPAMDANVALNMLLEDKNKYGGKWGSGPPYNSMPNNGLGMQPQNSSYGSHYQQNQGQGGHHQNYNSNPGHNNSNQYQQYAPAASQPQTSSASAETEIFPCPKIYMGRVIGQKGVTVNDLQNKSSCDIQINQDVPPGHDCQITLRGARIGIEHAKQMLNEIIDLGPNHPYAGGRGGSQHNPQQDQSQGHTNQNNAPPNQYYPQQQRQPQNYAYYPNNQYQNAPPPYQQQQSYAPPPQQQTYTNQQYQPNYYQQQQQQPYNPQQPQQVPQMYNSPVPQMNVRPPPQQQQQPWKSAKAADGQIYYYNETTGETQWDKPPGF